MEALVMLNWLGKCLCIVAAIGVLDGHLMLAQSWAWVSMMQDRAPEQGMTGALESTFSGDAPCPMCCAIQEERQEQEEQMPVPESDPLAKYLPEPRCVSLVLFPPVAGFQSQVMDVWAMIASRQDAPPSPPPQVVV